MNQCKLNPSGMNAESIGCIEGVQFCRDNGYKKPEIHAYSGDHVRYTCELLLRPGNVCDYNQQCMHGTCFFGARGDQNYCYECLYDEEDGRETTNVCDETYFCEK